MAKKDFSTINTGKAETGVTTGAVYDTLERGQSAFGQQGTASPEEQKQRRAKLQTQGRKGCKLPRINMAFTDENHQYVEIMSRIKGQTMARFINDVLEAHREANSELYQQARAIIDGLEGNKDE